MDWRKEFLESSILGQSTDKSSPSEVQSKCISMAYRDMLSAGRYYSKSFQYTYEEICSITAQNIADCGYSFSRDLIQKTAILFCNDMIGQGNRYITGYGLAQKLINMTYKYLYVFSDRIFVDRAVPDFSLCDCPLDSIILNKASLNRFVWSKLTETQYQHCQDVITKLLKAKNLDRELSSLGNLAFDFLSW